jgi:hypothetical protein
VEISTEGNVFGMIRFCHTLLTYIEEVA